MAAAESVHQQVLQECAGGQCAELRVEAHAQQARDAGRRQRIHLVAPVHEARRRRIALEELLRLRLENHHRIRQLQPRARPPEQGQDGLVAAMHAIEIADGQHGAVVTGAQVVEAADQFHRSIWAGEAGRAV